MSNSSSTTKKYGTAPIFKGATKQIEDHIFYFGTGMQQKFRESAKKLLSYAGRTYGVSTQMSIELGTTTIAEMDKPSYTFTDDEFYKKSYHEKRMINDDYDDWKKAKQKVRDGLSAMFAVLMGQCHPKLQAKIKKDTEYVAMPRPCVMKLWIIVKRVCQGLESTNNCLMTAMEFMFNFHLIREDKYEDLQLQLLVSLVNKQILDLLFS